MKHEKWDLKYRGTIFGVYQSVTESGKVFEEVRRSPGVRLLIPNDKGQILLNQEKRRSIGYEVDYRLPGGKVFDDIGDSERFRYHPDLASYVIESAMREAKEEIGLTFGSEDCEVYAQDCNDGKVEFDLYFVVVNAFYITENGPAFSDTEYDEIVGWQWHDFDEARQLALDYEKFSEGRSARMLLNFLSNK